jgi:hypothetical protein
MKKVSLILYVSILSISCNSQKKEKTSIDNQDNVKSSQKQTIKNDINDGWNNNIYTNALYKFKIEFPNEWQHDNGASDRTLARTYDRKLGASFSMQVIHLPKEFENSNDIWKSVNEAEMLEATKIETSQSFKEVNNIKIEKGYLKNNNAYIVSLNHKVYSGTRSFKYLVKQVKCFKNGKLYQITFTIPDDYFNDTMSILFTRVIDSFLFIP